MLRVIRPRILLIALLALPLAGVTACDDSPTDSDSEDVRGVWVSQAAGETVYIEITNSAVAIFHGRHDTCFEHIEYEIVSASGGVYTLGLPGTSLTADLLLLRAGDQLEVRDPSDPGSVAFYDRSSVNTSQLEVCVGGGADPAIVCTDLPQIAVGEELNGALGATDPTSVYGTYFDLYGLQLASARRVTIEMGSADVDSYLVVYSEGGAEIALNDDANNDTSDASLTLDLAAGCYRIEATSFDPEETGPYTLSVN